MLDVDRSVLCVFAYIGYVCECDGVCGIYLTTARYKSISIPSAAAWSAANLSALSLAALAYEAHNKQVTHVICRI